jgi:acyl-CoA synthetase (AMP-forming)/AMP-acid ligase II
MERLPCTFFGPTNLVELLRHRVRHQADQVTFIWLVDGEHEKVELTYRELDRRARAIGAWLESKHLAGSRALLCYPPGLEFVAAFFGCLYAQVVAVPVYPPRRNQFHNRLESIAEDACAEVALTTDTVMNRIRPLIEDTPVLRSLDWMVTCHVPPGIEDTWEPPRVDGQTLAFLQYTSGSTGRPKGVMLTHGNLMHNSAVISYCFEATRSVMGVFWLPSYHDMGLIGGILEPLYIGCPCVMMAPMAFLQKPYRWLSAISRFGGTTSGGPNFAYDLCVRKITPQQRATLNLSTWKVAFNGAEPVRAETLDRFIETFAPCGFRPESVYPCYGMAEATLIITGGYAKKRHVITTVDGNALAARQAVRCDASHPAARRLVGCGYALPDQQVRIVDPQTRATLGPAAVGEIWLSGPSVAQGYWRQSEATRDSFEARTADTGEGPFLRTGDLGFLLDDELYVTGRRKDLLIIRGLNHYPQDIEHTVEKCHPLLRPGCSAAFAVEANQQEHLIVAAEVERRSKADHQQVFSAVRHAVSKEHDLAVSAIVLLKAGSIPKTSSGKIQRHACQSGVFEGGLAAVGHWIMAGIDLPGIQIESSEETTSGEETPPATFEAAPTPAGAAAAPAASPEWASVVETVLEEIRRVARDRAAKRPSDAPLAELELDAIERRAILASIERRFATRLKPRGGS